MLFWFRLIKLNSKQSGSNQIIKLLDDIQTSRAVDSDMLFDAHASDVKNDKQKWKY